ncbi:MAG: peptidoglycan bridge formation glycyltransferase FemA/FemB family protein [Candidatus Saccharibacteria bacterium]|nr:peptidoglycan bridge formation glycyltransferase FemA/FemB family protein [Candidatus Saccharibacteria bacterium]
MKVIDIKSKSEWDDFVKAHAEANFLQSWDFYEFHKSRGNEIVRRGIKKQGKIIAVYAGVVENAKRGRHLAIAGGPILDWNELVEVRALFEDMKLQAKNHRCVFVRVRPQLELSDDAKNLFEKILHLKKAPMYLSVEYAGILDLTKSEEDIMKGMRQRLRRALRKGAKNNITIEKSTNPKDIHTFYEIELQTAKRHDFYAFSEDFLIKQFTAFAKNDEAVLYIAKKDGEILAENFMIFYGNEASYHYGVSSELGTKLSGAPLLHMEAMRDARARGIKRYSLWGIVGENETNHRFYGVSQFKRGFGVDELKYLPAHDLVISPIKYLKTWLVETLRRKIRHV